ncbi:MAG: radical SAM protein [Bdellovibrionia bacterium]
MSADKPEGGSLEVAAPEEGLKASFTKDNLPEWFCPVPFASIIFNPEGNVSSCRELGAFHKLGDIRKNNWQEIWNGEGFRSLRREFLTGNIKTCSQHIKHRRCHKDSFNTDLTKFIDLTEIQKNPPLRMSPDFNGKCNLKCEMCVIWKKPNGLYDELPFWEDAEKTLYPFLQQIDPLSGEPFIQKDTYRLMEFMGKTNPKAVWKITTNAHWKFTPYVAEKLDKINIFRVNVSVDSLDPENYPKIRREGDLKVVLKCIDDLVKYREERKKRDGRDFNLMINILIQQHNWWEMENVVKFALERDCRPFMQFLYEPTNLSLLSLNRKTRIKIMEHYLKMDHGLRNRHCKRVWTPLEDSVLRDTQELAKKIEELDTKPQFPEQFQPSQASQ